MGWFFSILAITLGIIFVWGVFAPRSQWRALSAWSVSDEHAHEPGGTAYGWRRFLSALGALVDIMEACDGIMVARGDLAVEVGDAHVPALQKRMIRVAREHNKLTITATQMMESMVSSPVPTRAEVSDVANAVLDGTDAVMLSAESASGKYPVETIEAMSRICLEAERSADLKLEMSFLDRLFTRVDQSIAMASLFTAFHLNVKAIVTLTQSGSTALWMSRLNTGVPIYALTSETSTRYRVTLFRDVYPLMISYHGHHRDRGPRASRATPRGPWCPPSRWRSPPARRRRAPADSRRRCRR